MIKDKLFYIGQKALIERNGEILILFKNNTIDFPGGKIQDNETDILKALKREVTEETQLEIAIGQPFLTWQLSPSKTTLDRSIYFIAFTCKYIKGEVTLSNEHSNYKWVNKDNYHEIQQDTIWFEVLKKYFELR